MEVFVDVSYPSSCPFCSVRVDIRQLVGGAWDMFEVTSAIKCHRCPHPTVLYQARVMSARPAVAVPAVPVESVIRASPRLATAATIRSRSPRPYSSTVENVHPEV